VWTRILGALGVALGAFLVSLWRILRQLLHEIAGALFVVFAVMGGASVWREWQRGAPEWMLALVAGFTGMMAAFAVASFRSAGRLSERKMQKSK